MHFFSPWHVLKVLLQLAGVLPLDPLPPSHPCAAILRLHLTLVIVLYPGDWPAEHLLWLPVPS